MRIAFDIGSFIQVMCGLHGIESSPILLVMPGGVQLSNFTLKIIIFLLLLKMNC